jgi:flagellar protein FlbD
VIEVTKLDGETLYVSPHQIEFMDENPDTVLHMVSDKKVIVRESGQAVIDRIIEYRQRIGGPEPASPKHDSQEGS